MTAPEVIVGFDGSHVDDPAALVIARRDSESQRFYLDRWVTGEGPPPAVRCGRIDDHEPHEWTRPRLFGAGRAVRYWCKGPGVLEGGAR